jgi:hypothetical protein
MPGITGTSSPVMPGFFYFLTDHFVSPPLVALYILSF